MDASETGWPEETPGSSGDELALRFPRHHAFVVGIDTYAHGISPLRTAAADARRLAEVLARQHRFTVHPPLLDGAASRAQLLRLLDTTMPAQVGADDRVLLYFAGHGVAADGDDGPAGYLVPSDARPRDTDSLLPMSALQAALDALPCRHLLVILDCCFSGAFRWGSAHRDTFMVPKKLYRERFDRFIADPARQVITSSAHDQKALDVLASRPTGERGQVECDGQAHSPFAAALFRALDGHADMWATDRHEGDGVITATELYAYLRDEIEPATLAADERLRQTPSFFALRGHDKGEFVFLHPHHRLNLPAMDPADSPYKGLRSFEMNDAHLFYGRERVVRELRRRFDLADERLLVVTGASGTGKSSVVKAGLMPQLKDAGWNLLEVLRPGDHPDTALAGALLKASAKSVLVIDQMEEAVTRCADPEARARFEAGLARLLDGDGPVSKVIVTVRSDFEPQFFGGPLGARWKTARFTVPPFSAAELRQVVEMPALQASMIFEPPSLVDRMVEEVVQAAGALPLLSYALSELFVAYQQRGGADRAITQGDYERLGGVTGALTQKADALWAALDASGQDDLRRIMLRMVSLGSALAGRRVPRREIAVSAQDEEPVNRVVDQLEQARLVVATQDGGVDCIEPAHDALIRAWPRLLQWIDAFPREKLSRAGRLATAAAEHAQRPEREAHGLLWHDNPDLPAVERDLRDGPPWFNPREQAFIRASVARKRRRLQLGIAGVLAVLLIMAGATFFSVRERNAAVQAASDAKARELAVLAESQLAVSPERALLLGVEAHRLKPIPQAAAVIRRADAELGYRLALRPASPDPFQAQADIPQGWVSSAQLAADGRTMLVVDLQTGLSLWDAVTGAPRQLAAPAGGVPWVNGPGVIAKFTPDGSSLLTSSGDGVVRLWDAHSGRMRWQKQVSTGVGVMAQLSPDGESILLWDGGAAALLATHDGRVLGALASPAGQSLSNAQWMDEGRAILIVLQDLSWYLLAGRGTELQRTGRFPAPGGGVVTPAPRGHLVVDGGLPARLWDLGSGQNLARLGPPDGTPGLQGLGGQTVWWSPDGRALVQNRVEPAPPKEIRSWLYRLRAPAPGTAGPSAAVDEPIALAGAAEVARVVAFSPDGRWLVAGDAVGGLRLHDARTGETGTPLPGHSKAITSIEFSRDGRWFLTASADGTARLWTGQGTLVRTLRADEIGLFTAFFSRDGGTIVTVGDTGVVRLWEWQAKEEVVHLRPEIATRTWLTRKALSADATRLAVSDPQSIRIFDLEARAAATPGALLAPVQTLEAKAGAPALGVRFSPDGRYLAVVGGPTHGFALVGGATQGEYYFRLWDIDARRLLVDLPGRGKRLTHRFSPDGKQVATHDGEQAQVWWLHDGSPAPLPVPVPADATVLGYASGGAFIDLKTPDGATHACPVAAFWICGLLMDFDLSSDGRTLLGSDKDTRSVFQASRGRSAQRLTKGTASLSPDGSTVVLQLRTTRQVRLLDTASASERTLLALGSQQWDSDLTMARDAALMVAVSEHKQVAVVDLASGTVMLRVPGRDKQSTSLAALRREGRELVVVYEDASVEIRRCVACRPLQQVIDLARQRVGRSLTAQERQDFGVPEQPAGPRPWWKFWP